MAGAQSDFEMQYSGKTTLPKYGEEHVDVGSLPSFGNTPVAGAMTPAAILKFVNSLNGMKPMNETELRVYDKAMTEIANIRDRRVLANCRLHVLPPASGTYSRSFTSGRGENQFVVSARSGSAGEPEFIWVRKSSDQLEPRFPKVPFVVILCVVLALGALVAGLGLVVKNKPIRTRMDGVLHARVIAMDGAHDPYADPQFTQFPEGKLY